jgi:hypothetical protein
MVHIGTIQDEYMGERKEMNKVRLTFELPTETKVFREENGEQPYVVSKEFTLSLHEKATLRHFLESWRGKGFTEEEAKRFDISKLLGATCMLNIIHKQKKDGNMRADIASISAMPKGLQCPPQVNANVLFTVNDFDPDTFERLPEFLREKIKTSKEYKAMQAPQLVETPTEHIETSNDLPF